MMDLETIRELNRAQLRLDAEGRRTALARLGDPSPEALAERALEGLADPDRNARVQMVRLLAIASGPLAVEGILRALSDPARRVRRLAARDCARHAGDPRVRARLLELVDDTDEIPRIRSAAFFALSTARLLAGLASAPDDARHLFSELPELDRTRRAALDLLVSLDPLSDTAREALKGVVETGSREEAVLATRALSGFKVVNLGAIADPAERRRIAQTCEPARERGRVFFWVPRETS